MSQPVRLRPRRPCPICNKPSLQKFHPFCSARCADADLYRWLGGHYAIPAREHGAEEADPDADGRQAQRLDKPPGPHL